MIFLKYYFDQLIVYKNHKRTSTYIKDLIDVCLNIPDKFISGEVYNVAGDDVHTIEHIAKMIVDLNSRSQSVINYKDSEIMTTKDKITSNFEDSFSKARKLHKDSFLEIEDLFNSEQLNKIKIHKCTIYT